MQISEILAKVKTMSGYPLNSLMRKAENRNREIFNACFERAKELNASRLGDWNEAVKRFLAMSFPSWKPQIGNQIQQIELEGYTCDISQTTAGNGTIVSQSMALINHKTNSCLVNYFVKNKEVSF